MIMRFGFYFILYYYLKDKCKVKLVDVLLWLNIRKNSFYFFIRFEFFKIIFRLKLIKCVLIEF